MNTTFGKLSFATKLWASFLLIFLNVFTILANLLVIGIVLGNHRLRKCTNYLVVNLSIADLLFACISYPFAIRSVINDKENTNHALCQFVGFSDSFYATTASFTMAIIAYERYYSIIHCLHYEKCMMNRNTKPVIVVVWVTSLIISVVPLLNWGTYGYERHQYKCTLNLKKDNGYFFFKIISTFLIPLTVMSVCYSWIFVVAKRHAATISTIEIRVQNELLKGGVQKSIVKKKYHTGTVFITIIVHVICWLPINALYLVKNLSPSTRIPNLAISISCLLSFLSSGINPIAYALVTGKFRKGFMRIIRKVRLRRSSLTLRKTSPATWTLSSARFSRRGSTSNAKIYRSENNLERAVDDRSTTARQSGALLDIKKLERGQRVLSPIEVNVDDNFLTVPRYILPSERVPIYSDVHRIGNTEECCNN
ncbi:melatonin receptor type 1A-like [Xenia sp. Carnegie-2017]|uniref:melatonin receptor type 1A-like n=1 Tax=Xenia sp. Carnegie-2017 TaxID=2897299 RepID=UPI001F04D193|nr:melatonin receptor type 1A-like [Xenia sp. Carnegie-2017]